MHERYEAIDDKGYVVPSKLMTVLARGMRGAKDWDEEFFREAWDVLTREYQDASSEERMTILMDRYFDATRWYEGGEQSRFQTRFVAPIPNISNASEIESQIVQGSVLVKVDPRAEKYTMVRPVEIYQYGPSRIYDVPPGSWVQVPRLGEQDVVATTDLTACSVVLGRGKRGVFFAHVLSSDPDQIRGLFDQLASDGDMEERFLLAPFWKKRNGDLQKDWNERLERCAQTAGASLSWFPYVGYETDNPHDIDSTTVLASHSGMRQVGARFRMIGSPFATRVRHRTKICSETIQDFMRYGGQ